MISMQSLIEYFSKLLNLLSLFAHQRQSLSTGMHTISYIYAKENRADLFNHMTLYDFSPCQY